ncbi:MAG: hypothetical protein QW717_03365 [Candidatus Bathyarchaeia archaeon]
MGVSSKNSKFRKAFALVIILVAALVAAYLSVAYPKVVVDFSVSFTIGADVKMVEFEVPFLHEHVKVEVYVRSGSAVWTAKIIGSNGVLWSHTASQGGQTTYTSGWMKIISGRYNFSFATVGIGSLEAQIKLTSKGVFW